MGNEMMLTIICHHLQRKIMQQKAFLGEYRTLENDFISSHLFVTEFFRSVHSPHFGYLTVLFASMAFLLLCPLYQCFQYHWSQGDSCLRSLTCSLSCNVDRAPSGSKSSISLDNNSSSIPPTAFSNLETYPV